jgi:hypothetical protein
MRALFFPIITFSMLASSHLFAADLRVTIKGKESKLSAKEFNSLTVQTVEVVDPNESTARAKSKLKFRVYDGKEVLDRAFGSRENWTKAKVLTYECADGYKPALETKDFIAGKFYFAFAKDDGKEFSIINNLKDGKKADLAPFYIVWSDASMQTKNKAHYWPYQVVAVALP